MKTELRMTLKEADRLMIMKYLKERKITIKKAAIELRLSYKQTYRIYQRFGKEGAEGLISKRRGKQSNNHLSQEIINKVLNLIRDKYSDYGPTLACEKLEENHSLKISRETIRKLMIKEGIWKAKKIKERKYHPRRTRRSRIGELEQIDGSYDYWFEDRADKCCLLVCVDDATSSLMHLRFCKTESTQDYLLFLREYIDKHGKPLSFYSDKHSVFRVNNKKKYEGVFSTKFQNVLEKLDIELICAHSPQAKGRVERANGVLQDRLIKELRERGISSIEEANLFLEEFRLKYNRKFAIEPANSDNVHRSLKLNGNLEHLFMIEEERVLSKELSFQYKNEIYQIDSEFKHRLYGKKVSIYELNGKIQKVLQNGKELQFCKWKEKLEPTKIIDVKELEVFNLKTKPKSNHPWRQGNFLKKVGATSP